MLLGREQNIYAVAIIIFIIYLSPSITFFTEPAAVCSVMAFSAMLP